ncbi:MAG: 6-carboxytetrahydropterin synthase QueD [Deltaproteobacteria bacterium]|nr:6-carboxytetrahydropterin synthase QueD [Deltaproteobacteria bacterium]
MVVSREVTFQAFHSHHGMLYEPNHPHDFVVVIGIKADCNEEGFVCDFRAVKRTFNRVIKQRIEGQNLDLIFEYPTSENIAQWIWNELKCFYPLSFIEVREKAHSRAVYHGDNT